MWRLFEARGVTAVTYQWDVRTTRPLMNALAPVARRAFERNHDLFDAPRRRSAGEPPRRALALRWIMSRWDDSTR